LDRRKPWVYLILDEAHHIKNFQSQRWQTMLNFNTKRRLLLTGTPLQNDLMELWSLMHFLMPHIFASHNEFKDWFSNPLNGMAGDAEKMNQQLITRLHGVLRPFILRRLKSQVEKQLPTKTEHVVPCPLSPRQRVLYEEYMGRSVTKKCLSGGNYIGIMNVVMQLRKVCNHPDLFEVRPIVSPFDVPAPVLQTSALVAQVIDHDPFVHTSRSSIACLVVLEHSSRYEAIRSHALRTTHEIMVEETGLDKEPPDIPASLPLLPRLRAERRARYRDSRRQTMQFMAGVNDLRCAASPVYGWDLIAAMTVEPFSVR
jgi:E1A-binding protein p400